MRYLAFIVDNRLKSLSDITYDEITIAHDILSDRIGVHSSLNQYRRLIANYVSLAKSLPVGESTTGVYVFWSDTDIDELLISSGRQSDSLVSDIKTNGVVLYCQGETHDSNVQRIWNQGEIPIDYMD